METPYIVRFDYVVSGPCLFFLLAFVGPFVYYCNNIAINDTAKMDFKSHARNVLQSNYCSLTTSRMIVVDFLNMAKKPVNPYEMAADLNKSGKKIDVVTIYRILKLFENLGLVHKIGDRYSRCQDFACMDQTHCHHQFVCEKCDQIKEFHFNDAEFLKKIGVQFKDLFINAHNFQFFGLCENCKK